MSRNERRFPVYLVALDGNIPRWLSECLQAGGTVSVVDRVEEIPRGEAVVLVYAPLQEPPEIVLTAARRT